MNNWRDMVRIARYATGDRRRKNGEDDSTEEKVGDYWHIADGGEKELLDGEDAGRFVERAG
ncbi:MAG: hypothetical protein Q8P51_18030 [Ignavibacteria bacterium]|nr:hypothetical protein [Ignavibacteria bacterium]